MRSTAEGTRGRSRAVWRSLALARGSRPTPDENLEAREEVASPVLLCPAMAVGQGHQYQPRDPRTPTSRPLHLAVTEAAHCYGFSSSLFS